MTSESARWAPMWAPLDEMAPMVCKHANSGIHRRQTATGSTMPETTDVNAIRKTLGERNLVFVGMMGCGKSAIGRMVASALKLPFADSDVEIATAADLSIPEIFDKFGEDYFRKGEQRVVQRLLKDGPGVISLGGGAFIPDATRQTIRSNAISIWLTADAEMLMTRLKRRPNSRPLLKTADPMATLADLMRERDPVYRQADIHVESSNTSKHQTRDKVLEALARWLEAGSQSAGALKQGSTG